ncbi:hypothetical protein SISNIDRAFT_488909 [Sistotremastrum niveocremeum HHB9708]|uniref:Uncharacterized protein n=1 Tax=Sistotremastrum niveocremeum HHB9708 TaxID=1314777 RepID=A0A164QK86_9AGAM|nr:hypothetical protein SISNIDRAFT_488909 [Sistotremastrum niveocremeum HHB9708]
MALLLGFALAQSSSPKPSSTSSSLCYSPTLKWFTTTSTTVISTYRYTNVPTTCATPSAA